jgi:hypothetical protein
MSTVTDPVPAPPEPADVQGIIVRGYGRTVPYKRHMIFRIDDVTGAQQFLKALLPASKSAVAVSDAEVVDKTDPSFYRLNVAVTFAGLQKLVSADNCKAINKGSTTLFTPYMTGADAAATAAKVGDVGTSAPANWWQNGFSRLPGGKPPTPGELHIVVSVYAQSPDQRDDLEKAVVGLIPAPTKTPALVLAYAIDSDPLDDRDVSIHFGYGDGFSQPRIEGWDKLAPSANGTDDRPEVPAWHFVVAPPGDTPYDYSAHPFLWNGSFAAFRVLHQDSEAFENFLDGAGADKELLAAKMCGRWRNGTPLEVSPDSPSVLQGFELTNFDYLAPTPNQVGVKLPDPVGVQCPTASHIRRTNPRDDTPAVRDNPDMASFHRVMRRANAYGPKYIPGDNEQRGLV